MSPDAGPGRAGRPRSTAADDAILRATLDVVVEHGIRDASVDAIAARAHAGKDTIYRRWPHKDQLIRAALEHALDADLAVPRSGIPANDLVRYLEALDRLLVASTTGTILRELVAEAPRDPAVAVRVRAFQERHLAALAGILSSHPSLTPARARVLADVALGWATGRRLMGASDGGSVTDAVTLGAVVEELLPAPDRGPGRETPGPAKGEGEAASLRRPVRRRGD